MPRTRLVVLPIALAALLVAVFATPALAAKRQVPRGFFGTVLSSELRQAGISDTALNQQMGAMARSGVEIERVQFNWPTVEPARGVYDWSEADRLVATAAIHHVRILANVWTTPKWISPRPNDPVYYKFPPTDNSAYAEVMRQFVQRYGPRGSFWAQNKTLPRVPIREWQIWNEPMAPWFWASQPWVRSFKPLLRAGYQAIHRADRGAKVVAGSLVAVGGGSVKPGGYTQTDGIRDLYRGGAKRYFDVIAVHPFTNFANSVKNTVSQTLEIIRRVRVQMNRHGDRRKPIILTELTWPAAVGKVPRSSLLGLETTPKGQLARLKAVYRELVKERRKLGVTETYWYSWATPYDANSPQSDVTFRFTGLNRIRGKTIRPMPLLRAYSALAARYEGCRKGSNAQRCR
jgi:polysaccharide biosynthesis protein PslG